MDLRYQIENTFQGKAFERPLFYSYPGGLRFELSEGGSVIEQFLLALNKAMKVCTDIFSQSESLVVCLRSRVGANRFAQRELLVELHSAGIKIPQIRQIWLDPIALDERQEQAVEEWWLHVAFTAPISLLQNFLWCAFATDFSAIRPRPPCEFYLFNLERKVMVWPYDDRGMDVVGPNHDLLLVLYTKYQSYLLEYDRETMRATFG